MTALQSLLGLFVFCFIAWSVSENRKRVEWRVVLTGLLLQFVVAVALLKLPFLRDALLSLNVIVSSIDAATRAGTSFVFGYLGGGPLPFTPPQPGQDFILAFRALPIVLIMSALSSLLFFWKVMPVVVRGFAWVFQRTLGIGGAVAVSQAANIFVGMVEAPLFIRPYLKNLTRSELFTIMVGGMATIAGTVMVLYALTLQATLGEAALGHLLVASIISAPASIVIARLMTPETAEPTPGHMNEPHPATTSMDAVTHGAMDGLKLWLNIIAMLITLVALVALVNLMLGGVTQSINALTGWQLPALTLEGTLGWIMAPLVWLMGVPWSEAAVGGQLMGVKVVLNEFLAYLQMSTVPPEALSERSRLIMAYAICGFANFGSLGIMIGGLGQLAPDRRAEIVGLGLKSIFAGTLATMMTGAVVGFIYAF